MNGFIKRSIAILGLGGAVVVCGCSKNLKDTRLCDYYDNCWPERYSFQASQPVIQAFAAQVNNGHVLDQTVFTYHFEAGTDKLTRGGQEHLSYLARRRPAPDGMIYLQTAQDVTYDPAAPDQFSKDRADIDQKRVQAIQRYLNAETAGRAIAFNIAVHDAPTPGMAARPIGIAVEKHYMGFQGVLPPSSMGGAGGVGGGSSGGGSPR